VKPTGHYLRKYASTSCAATKRHMQLSDLRMYGRQLLEVLVLLNDKDFPYGKLIYFLSSYLCVKRRNPISLNITFKIAKTKLLLSFYEYSSFIPHVFL